MQKLNEYSLDDYKGCLERNEGKSGVMYPLRSNKNEKFLVKQTKSALNTFDDTRYCIGKYNSVPWVKRFIC